jgi:hypothetical protein
MSKSEKRNMTKGLRVRLLPDDHAEIALKAEIAGLTISEFFRRSALEREITAHVDEAVIRELRRLGGLQKHLFLQGDGRDSKQTAEVLMLLEKTIASLNRGA